jgi:Matrixin
MNNRSWRLFGIVLGMSMATSLLLTSSAEAYYKFGRVWSSTATTKYPTAFSGALSSSLLATTSTMNQKWGSLPNSSLLTGSVYVTNSLSAYESAPFTIWMEDTYLVYGETAPAFTYTCAGCNSARITLNSHWVWSNQFLYSPNNPDRLGYVDSATVVLHELGHAYGLDHPENDPNTSLTSAEIASVMYANFTIKRNPTQDDINGIASMY